ncbi:uncharacterized protein TNCV_2125461 [Trichonephila clavipes]|nr:uncharacterized protein TNCV_2125461 [Trichonephila clavipes]
MKKPNIAKENHVCSNFTGSSGNMELVGVFGMFERSKHLRKLQYSKYYGDGDSKAFEAVKSICYTRAFGDGPRNFERWSSDVSDT